MTYMAVHSNMHAPGSHTGHAAHMDGGLRRTNPDLEEQPDGVGEAAAAAVKTPRLDGSTERDRKQCVALTCVDTRCLDWRQLVRA